MPRETPPSHPTRKHLALAQRERRATRFLFLGVGLVLLAVVGLVGTGVAEQEFFKPRRPAVTVNGEEISRDELGARTALAQSDLLQERQQAEQMLAFFAGSPEFQQSLQQQINRINEQINNPGLLAGQVMQTLIQGRLIRQEAQRRGITVSEEDIDRAIAEAFGFYAEGTPTPAPTPTFDATLAAQSTPTSPPPPSPSPEASATATPPPATVTAGPSETPRPTATAYIREAFETDYRTTLDNIRVNLGVGESIFRDRFAETLYRDRLLESFEAEVPPSQEQVWAKHILVPAEPVALALLSRLRQGEDWDTLAAENSIDTSNKDSGGDLGWFGRGAMVDEFEQAAFAGQVDEIVGPVQTSFGWHLIWIVDRAERKLDQAAVQASAQQALTTWLLAAVESAELVFDPELVPPTETATPATTGQAEIEGATQTSGTSTATASP